MSWLRLRGLSGPWRARRVRFGLAHAAGALLLALTAALRAALVPRALTALPVATPAPLPEGTLAGRRAQPTHRLAAAPADVLVSPAVQRREELLPLLNASGNPVLQLLGAEGLARAAGRARCARVVAGRRVLGPGSGRAPRRGRRLYVVAEGEFLCKRNNRVVAKLGPGRLLGETAALWGRDGGLDVEAASPARLWALDLRSAGDELARCRLLGASSLCYFALAAGALGLIAVVLARWPAHGLGLKVVAGCLALEICCLLYEYLLNGLSNTLYAGEFSPTLQAAYKRLHALLPLMPLAAFARIGTIMGTRGLEQGWLVAAWRVGAAATLALVACDVVLQWRGHGAELRQVLKHREGRIAYAMKYSGLNFLLALLPSLLVMVQVVLMAAAVFARGQGPALLVTALVAFWLCCSSPGSPRQGAGELILEATYLVGLRL